MSALAILLSASLSLDGKVITLSDDTPADNLVGTNYWDGVTARVNLNISKATTNSTKPDKIAITDILVTNPDLTTALLTYASGSDWIPVATDTLDIDSTVLGLTGSGQDVLDDGVYLFNYYIWGDLSTLGNISITSGSQIVTCSASPLATAFIVGSYIRLNGTPYLITESLSSTTFKIVKPYGSTTLANVTPYIGYTKALYFLNTFNSECCVQKKIATADLLHPSCEECENKAIMRNMQLYTLVRGAKAQFAVGLYPLAQKTIDVITKLCGGDCGCGC